MNCPSSLAHNMPMIYCLESMNLIVLLFMEYVSIFYLNLRRDKECFCVHIQVRLSIFLATRLHKGSRMSSSVIVHCDNRSTLNLFLHWTGVCTSLFFSSLKEEMISSLSGYEPQYLIPAKHHHKILKCFFILSLCLMERGKMVSQALEGASPEHWQLAEF